MARADEEKLAQLREHLERTYGKNTYVSKAWLRRQLTAQARAPGAGAEPAPVSNIAPAPLSDAAPAPVAGGLEAVRADLGDCQRCKLSKTRKTIVFGEGNPTAQLMFVGEGPGEQEDAQGRPFVGPAGQLLDKIIEAMGLKRSDVFIANVVKCRPPGNRVPEPEEVAECSPFLFRQIEAIRPKVVVALGGTALKRLLQDDEAKISRERGRFRDWRGAKLMATFHPSYLLRTPAAKKEVWDDMKKVMAELEAT